MCVFVELAPAAPHARSSHLRLLLSEPDGAQLQWSENGCGNVLVVHGLGRSPE